MILPLRQKLTKKLEKYVQDNNIKGMPGKTNSDGEVMYRDLGKRSVSFCPDNKKHKLAIKYIKANLLS